MIWYENVYYFSALLDCCAAITLFNVVLSRNLQSINELFVLWLKTLSGFVNSKLHWMNFLKCVCLWCSYIELLSGAGPTKLFQRSCFMSPITWITSCLLPDLLLDPSASPFPPTTPTSSWPSRLLQRRFMSPMTQATSGLLICLLFGSSTNREPTSLFCLKYRRISWWGKFRGLYEIWSTGKVC